MNIKSPPCYDVSHWKEIPDFKLISPRPVLMITKATEAYPGSGYNHTDEKFVRFAQGMMEIGCTRGFYHFFRKLFDAKRQAEHFVNVISQIDILSSDILILDVEEGGEKASQLWSWFEVVRRAYPGNLLMLYSRKGLLDPIAMTEGEKAYFKRIPVWTAGYPYFPDLYSVCPSGYIPDQSKYGEVWLWQYNSHGRVTGIVKSFEQPEPTDVDLNWINPKLYTLIGDSILGEHMLINASGRCINASNKAWATIGGVVVGSYPLNAPVAIDQEQFVSGVKYIHITSPLVGGRQCWSKAQWFNYGVVSVPDPEPIPEPEPQPEPAYPPRIGYTVDGVNIKWYVPE